MSYFSLDFLFLKSVTNEVTSTPCLSESDQDGILASIRDQLSQENRAELTNLLTQISLTHDLKNIKLICKRLSTDTRLSETDVTLIIESVLQIQALSYNVSLAFLGILSDFVSEKLGSDNGQTVLSRQMFTTCSITCHKLTRQFILACLLDWTSRLNEDKHKLTNKLLTEFLVKLVKECFEETSAIILLQELTANLALLNWSENIYSVVSALNEKISNFKFEHFKSVIDKMVADMKLMSKSNVFSKLLLCMMNKFKQVLSYQPSLDTGQNMQTDAEIQVASVSSKNASLTHMIEQCLLIVENNQTILKRSLLNIVNSFKAENLV